MQNNVNAQNVINSLVYSFGENQIQTCDGGIIKLQVKELGNGDILTISNLLQWSDVRVKRSDKSLLILFIPKVDSKEYTDDVLKALESIQGGDLEDIDLQKPVSKNVEFEFVVKPVMEYLMGFHPHTSISINSTEAELLEGQISYTNKK